MAASQSGTDWLRQQVHKHTADPKRPLTARSVREADSVEAWLRKFGVKYSALTHIPLATIDEKRSRDNQARADAIVPESVDRFLLAIRKGDELPPIVVFPSGTRAVLIDGNNREAAHRKFGSTHIPGYVVDPETPSETIQLMTVDANAHHGVTPPLAWRLKQAQFLVSLGHSPETATDAAGVSKGQLADYQRVVRAEQRAKVLKVKDFSALAAGTKAKLGAIPSDPVFMQASIVCIETEMTLDEVTKFVREVKARPSDAEAVGHIAQVATDRQMERKAREALGKRPGIKSAKHALITGLGKIMHADPNEIARQVITDIERQELTRRCYEVSEKLLAITTALEKREERSVG